ncbi:DUF4998 domain-containing protein [Mucilaginibacter rubeus]|uniref:DUF5000 domain-containing protein n=1 Tax=Mucilaginibacter rubeus TaxID=2027860 RepID=A0A5C1I353_9SPHI|nr:DUF4998 domain-containing protein [Mucilaginibacter rubeus]QEM11710.1 hypothetical protein DEO27_017305 [Mucilaginibacter rubeus]
MKKILFVLFCCTVLATWYGCQKDHAKDYKKFLGDHEVVYTGAAQGAIVQSGNLRLGLKWKASSDPSIVKYVVYYNNNADSVVVNTDSKTDSVSTVINNLAEYTYSFTIYSFDAKGNKSIPYEVNNAKVYGPIYTATLLNRGYDATTPYTFTDDGYLKLNFITPDTINVGTTISYTDKNGESVQKVLSGDSTSITIKDYRIGTPITYNSSYIPVRNALDVFKAQKNDVFPTINSIIQCDKSLFKESPLPNDMGLYSGDTKVSNLWNGSTTPQAYPNIFHSDDHDYLPRTITFDMGRVYKHLTSIEEIGRNCCNNPDDFEVWGITDITNAATTKASNDPGWTAEAISKGWKLLKEVKRNDDGAAPFKVDFDANVAPARYIRIRVLHNANGDNRNVNMSQITFWASMLN